MKRIKNKGYVKELWETFEKTGSIGAYLLYNDIKRKSGKAYKTKGKILKVN